MFADMDSLIGPLAGMAAAFLVAAALAVWRDRACAAATRSESRMAGLLFESEQEKTAAEKGWREAAFHLANANEEIADLTDAVRKREEDAAYAQRAQQDAEKAALKEAGARCKAQNELVSATEEAAKWGRKWAETEDAFTEMRDKLAAAENALRIERDARRTAEDRLSVAEKQAAGALRECNNLAAQNHSLRQRLDAAERREKDAVQRLGELHALSQWEHVPAEVIESEGA